MNKQSPSIKVILKLVLFVLTVAIILFNIYVISMEDKVKVDIEITEVTMEDSLSGDEDIPTVEQLKEYWRAVMPDKDLPMIGTKPNYVPCTGGSHERI